MDGVSAAVDHSWHARVPGDGNSRTRQRRRHWLVVIVLAAGIACAQRQDPIPLSGGSSNPQELASHVLAAFAAGDRARLIEMSLSEDEFRRNVWPHLPAARPERNLPFDYVWGDLRQKSLDSLDQALERMRRERLDLQSIGFRGETSRYGTATVRRESVLVVRGSDGTVREIRLFGSMVEQDGRFKVFSYVTD